jgi:sensor c-di-GMP phosphodiesterase-like protein
LKDGTSALIDMANLALLVAAEVLEDAPISRADVDRMERIDCSFRHGMMNVEMKDDMVTCRDLVVEEEKRQLDSKRRDESFIVVVVLMVVAGLELLGSGSFCLCQVTCRTH